MEQEGKIAEAMALHRDGHTAQAEAALRNMLEETRADADVLYYLGRLLGERGELREAASLLEQSLEIAPDFPSRANNLGTLYQGMGDLGAAERWFGAAIAGDPAQSEAHFNLATVHHIQGGAEKAEAGYRRVIELDPSFGAAYVNLGSLLRILGHLDEAAVIAGKAVELQPGSAKAHNNLGVVQHERFELMAAFQSFKQATELNPDYADAFNNMGSVFRDENHLDGAMACYRKAIALNPELADAYNNLGSIQQRQGSYDAAVENFEAALRLNPRFPPALANMGTIHHRMNRQSEAIEMFRQALEVDPNYAEAHFNLSEVLLLTETDLVPGWDEHRWRWRKREFQRQWRDFDVPLWDGQDLNGKSIAVWGEQGIGEEIMYASMVPDLLAAGAQVIIECEPRLVPIFTRSFAGAACMARTLEPPKPAGPLDYHIATGDLGGRFRSRAEAFPKTPAFLQADPAQSAAFRARYQTNAIGPLVGISWYSNNPEIGWEKSIDLPDWRAVLEVEGIQFVDLQYGDTRDKREAFHAETGIAMLHDDSVDQLADLDAFAAQVAAMDLVISISNTTVHMAGALGVPTWVLLSEVPLWRWFQGRDDSPWYPSVRLLRQREAGKWRDIVDEAAAALRDWAAGPS